MGLNARPLVDRVRVPSSPESRPGPHLACGVWRVPCSTHCHSGLWGRGRVGWRVSEQYVVPRRRSRVMRLPLGRSSRAWRCLCLCESERRALYCKSILQIYDSSHHRHRCARSPDRRQHDVFEMRAIVRSTAFHKRWPLRLSENRAGPAQVLLRARQCQRLWAHTLCRSLFTCPQTSAPARAPPTRAHRCRARRCAARRCQREHGRCWALRRAPSPSWSVQ